MTTYSFKKILEASLKDVEANQKDSATPAEIYISRHLNGGVKKGDKKAAIEYLKNKKLI